MPPVLRALDGIKCYGATVTSRRLYRSTLRHTQSRQLPELFRITLFILKAVAARNIKCNTATLKPPRERDKLRDDHKMVKAWMNFNWSLNSLALLCEMIWLFSSPLCFLKMSSQFYRWCVPLLGLVNIPSIFS